MMMTREKDLMRSVRVKRLQYYGSLFTASVRASFGLAFIIFVLGVLGFIIGTCGYLICWSGMLMGAIGREAGVFLRDLADVAQELGTDAIGEVKSIKNRTQHEKQSLLEVQEKLRKETEDE